MIKKSIIKRTCAGILAFLMVGTSNPIITFADVDAINSSEESIEVSEDAAVEAQEVYAEEADSDLGIIELVDSEYIEEDTIPVTLDIENVKTIDYVFGYYNSVSGRIIVPYDRGNVEDIKLGIKYYTVRDLIDQKTVTIDVPTAYPYLIIRNITSRGDDGLTYCKPIVTSDGKEHEKLTNLTSKVYYNNAKNTQIVDCYVFDNDNLANVYPLIALKSKVMHNASISIENIESFDYTISDDLDNVVESYGTFGTTAGSQVYVSQFFSNNKTTFTANVPEGYTLAIWNIKIKYPDTHGPESVVWNDEIQTMTEEAVKLYGESEKIDAFLFEAKETGPEINNISITSGKLCKAVIGVNGINSFKYIMVSPTNIINKPVHVEADDVFEFDSADFDDVDGIKQTATIEGIPQGYYLMIFDIDTDEDTYVVTEAGDKIAAEGNLISVDDADGVAGYTFKIDADKDDVIIDALGINNITIALSNIRSISYVVAKDLENIPEGDVKYNVPCADLDEITITAEDGYSIIIIDAAKKNDDYYAPEVTINGVKQTKQTRVGQIKKKVGGYTPLDGYIVAKSGEESTGICIASKAKTHSVKISTYKGEQLSYAIASSKEKLKKTVEDALNEEDESEYGIFNTVYVKDGVSTLVDVDLDHYLAIYDLTPNKGCYGNFVVTNGNEPVEPIEVNLGTEEEPEIYTYYIVGLINEDKGSVRAEVKEDAYDVVLFTQDVETISYLVTDGFNGKASKSDIVEATVTELDPTESDWLHEVANGEAYKYYNVTGLDPAESQTEEADEADVLDHIKDDQVPVNNPHEATKYGFVRISRIPAGKSFVITKIKKIGGTVLNNDTIYIGNELITSRNLGTYKDGSKLTGWTLGSIKNSYPVYKLDKFKFSDVDVVSAKYYVINSNLVTVISDNYEMDITLKPGPEVKIGFGDGYVLRKSESAYKYYTDVKWNEDKTDFETKDLKFDLKSTSKEYDVYVWDKDTQKYVLKADVYARAYKTDENGVTKYTDLEDISDTFDPVLYTAKSDEWKNSCRFTVAEDIIHGWLEESPDEDKWETIQIIVEPYLEVKFPTEEDSNVLVFKYNPDLKSVAAYIDDGEPLEINGEEVELDQLIGENTKARFGQSFSFVVVPQADLVDDFAVSSVTEKRSSHTFTKVNYPDGVDIPYYYQLNTIDSDIEIISVIKTKNNNGIEFTLINETELSSGNEFGKASVKSSDIITPPKSFDAATATYTYGVAANVTDVTFTITETQKYAQLEFELDGEIIDPVSHTDAGVYTFKIPARLLIDAEIIIRNSWLTKDFYIQYNPEHVKVLITSKNREIKPEADVKDSLLEAGYKIYHYEVPADENSIINARARDNCKINNALISGSSKKFDYAGNYTYFANKDNSVSGSDFIIYSEALKTLYFGAAEYSDEGELILDGEEAVYDFEPHLTNKYTSDVSKEKLYAAYIRFGDIYEDDAKYPEREGEHKRLELPVTDTLPSDVVVTAKIGSKDYTNTIVRIKDDIMYLTLANEDVAGQKVVLTVKEGSATRATLTLNVSPYVKTVAIKGEKNNTITQDLLSDNTYNVTFNKGVIPEDVVAVYQYMDSEGKWVTYTDSGDDATNRFTIGSKKYRFFEYDGKLSKFTLRANPEIDLEKDRAGMPPMQVLFFDKTNPTFDEELALAGESTAALVATKTIDIKAQTLANTTPNVKLISATDLELNFDITAPKSYVNYYGGKYLTGATNVAGLYYIVKARATDKNNRPSQMTDYNILAVPATGSNTTVNIPLGKAGLALNPGDGAAWKYDVSVQAVYGINPTLSTSGVDYELKPEYGISKTKVLKNQSTKDPYHETKLGVTAKNNKFYQDQKNVYVGQAKFSKQTTFFDLTFSLRYPDGTEVSSVTVRQGDPDNGENPADIFIVDSANLKPGSYNLYIYPDPASSAAVLPLTVYESIKDGNFAIVLPSDELYRKDGSTASMTAKVTFERNPDSGNYPKTQKVTWSLEKAPGASEDYDITKYVSVNPSTGKVTVSKTLEIQKDEADNQFVLVATAADFAGDPVRKVVSDPVTINSWSAKVGELIPYLGTDPVEKTSGKYKVESNGVNSIKISDVALAKNCEIKSSNKKVIEIVGPSTSDSRTIDIKVNGLGKAKITVTCLDGGKSSSQVEIEIIPTQYELGLTLGDTDLDPNDDGDTINELSISDILGSRIIVVDDDGDEITADGGLSDYSLSLSGGAKMINYERNSYLDITGPEFTFKLTDKTRDRKDPLYLQSFVVKLSDYDYDTETGKAITKGLSLALKSSAIMPTEGTIVSLNGLRYNSDESYNLQAVMVPDVASALKSGDDYYEDFANTLTDDSLVNGGMNFVYSNKLKAFVPEVSDVEKPEIVKTAMQMEALKGVPGKNYKYTVLLYQDTYLVSIKSLTVKTKPVPKTAYGIITSYGTSAVGKEDVTLRSDDKKCKNVYGACKYEAISDASIKGKIDISATEYFELDDGVISVKDNVDDLIGKTVYCNVRYTYNDVYGNTYEKTEMINIIVRRKY